MTLTTNIVAENWLLNQKMMLLVAPSLYLDLNLWLNWNHGLNNLEGEQFLKFTLTPLPTSTPTQPPIVPPLPSLLPLPPPPPCPLPPNATHTPIDKGMIPNLSLHSGKGGGGTEGGGGKEGRWGVGWAWRWVMEGRAITRITLSQNVWYFVFVCNFLF